LQTDFQGATRAFLNEGAHGGEIDALFARFFAAGVNRFQPCVTAKEEMIQAKRLLIEGSSRGAITTAHSAVSFFKLRIHRTDTS